MPGGVVTILSISHIMTRNGVCRFTTIRSSSKCFWPGSFQAGLSWITILRKRENFRKAFRGFRHRVKIARFTKRDFERLMNDAGIVETG